MEQNYRPLTRAEIEQLTWQGCSAEDWQKVAVHEAFTPDAVTRTAFQGTVRLGSFLKPVAAEGGLLRPSGIRDATLINVRVGDNCLIEHIGTYIADYDIGDECCLSGVGVVRMLTPGRFGNAVEVPVLSETGGRYTLTLHENLSAQEALIQCLFNKEERERWQRSVSMRYPPHERGCIESHSLIVRTKEITGSFIGEGARVVNATLLDNVTLRSHLADRVTVMNDCILRNVIVCSGAEVMDEAKLHNCFVGQHTHIGSGFSGSNSLFFANCHMDNGEACSVFAGPFTVSHHKNTLLIGCRLAFANLGSGTNMSNHLYKMGPVHHGTMESGCKTASSTHLVWPAHIGAFSMVMGKVATHPDASLFPFSYLFGEGDKVWLAPGANCFTYGTYRDMHKWEARDERPAERRTDAIYTYGLLNPLLIRNVTVGLQRLEELERQTQDNVITVGQLSIRRTALRKGIRHYRRMLTLLWGNYFVQVGRPYLSGQRRLSGLSAEEVDFSKGWMDLCGTPLPVDVVTKLTDRLKASPDTELFDAFRTLLDEAIGSVDDYFRLWQCSADGISDARLKAYAGEYTRALAEWRDDVVADLHKEAGLGDVDPEELEQTISRVRSHFDDKIAAGDKILRPALETLCK